MRCYLTGTLASYILSIMMVGGLYFSSPKCSYAGWLDNAKEKAMRKLLLVVLMVSMLLGCANAAHAVVEGWVEEPKSKELQVFCQAKANSLHRLFSAVIATDRYLIGMIHGDTEDFVPILFAQCKMENLGIMLFSILTEAVRTMKAGEVSDVTLRLLDQYIDFLRYDLIKAKLFEGLIGDHNSWVKSSEQLALKAAAAHLEVAYDLLIHMKERLEGFK